MFRAEVLQNIAKSAGKAINHGLKAVDKTVAADEVIMITPGCGSRGQDTKKHNSVIRLSWVMFDSNMIIYGKF